MPARMLARIPVPAGWKIAWEGLSARERRFALVAIVVVLLAAAWWLIWQPMQVDMERARRDVIAARSALATARAQSDELAGLQRATAEATPSDPRVAIERVVGERGVKAALTSLEAKDNRLHVTFAGIGFDALVGVLDALARSEGLRATEATLTARVDPGTVRAEITLAR